jgi:hypothetical protein
MSEIDLDKVLQKITPEVYSVGEKIFRELLSS